MPIRPDLAESLGRSAVEAIELGYYLTDRGKVDCSKWVQAACKAKVSIQPNAALPEFDAVEFDETIVQVTNETTPNTRKPLP